MGPAQALEEVSYPKAGSLRALVVISPSLTPAWVSEVSVLLKSNAYLELCVWSAPFPWIFELYRLCQTSATGWVSASVWGRDNDIAALWQTSSRNSCGPCYPPDQIFLTAKQESSSSFLHLSGIVTFTLHCLQRATPHSQNNFPYPQAPPSSPMMVTVIWVCRCSSKD